MRVTAALTQLADAAVDGAVRHLLSDAARHGRLAPVDPAKPETAAATSSSAMGKMGAGELNYSSDIDLIVFYDSAAPELSQEPSPFFVRLTAAAGQAECRSAPPTATCSAHDLRLRPDPARPRSRSRPRRRSTTTRASAELERAALIKARACAGDIAAGATLHRPAVPVHLAQISRLAAVADIHWVEAGSGRSRRSVRNT